MRTKIFYIVSDINKALSFEWICKGMDKNRFDLGFIILGNQKSDLIRFLDQNRIVFYSLPFKSKRDFVKTWFRIYSVLRKEKPAIVHCHLYYANLLGLSAAWLLGISKRVYTRHHASLHHQYFPRAVMLDKIINRLATDIVVLSKGLETIVKGWEGTPGEKIHLIPHGFDLDYFLHADARRIQLLRASYELSSEQYPVIGVIARYTKWKGIQYIIPAFKELLKDFPQAHLIVANAIGDYKKEIKEMLVTLPEDSYSEIQFEADVASLYKTFDVFVHAPVDEYCEAFGQTYVEALAAGIPSVFTLSGIARDFIKNEYNALVVNFEDASAITMSIKRVLHDNDLKARLVLQGREDVKKLFSVSLMIKRLEDLYQIVP